MVVRLAGLVVTGLARLLFIRLEARGLPLSCAGGSEQVRSQRHGAHESCV